MKLQIEEIGKHPEYANCIIMRCGGVELLVDDNEFQDTIEKRIAAVRPAFRAHFKDPSI